MPPEPLPPPPQPDAYSEEITTESVEAHRALMDAAAGLGAYLIGLAVAAAHFTYFAGSAFRGLGSVRSWGRWDRLGRQLFFVGTASLPVLMVTGLFIGMVLSIEGYPQFSAVGQEAKLGGIISVSLVKQIGPVLAATILAGRVGCALTAELGSMRVTEQLDAMQAMAADPVRVLACPRLVACVVMIPVLVTVSNLCGVGGAWFVVTKLYGADNAEYWRFAEMFVSWWEIGNGLIKSLFFGCAIGLIACYKGFTCQPGAVGVGRATTESFVISFLTIVVMNLVLAKMFNDLNMWRLGDELQSVLGS
jgi:phospholipid/cholesterol/gamma-HCH transport system permease protein